MDLLQRIMECKDEEIDDIIKEAIEEANANSEKIEKLGFLNYGKSNSLFKGFIPLDTRIKYGSLNIVDYSMQTTDYMYEFAHFIKQYNINTKGYLIRNLEYFINVYFGMPGNADRDQILEQKALEAATDDGYFEAIENNKLGDLKYKGAAKCTERSALAQQILSLFGTESYYCMGCVDFENHQEGHCFNIVKRKADYAVLDYSCPVTAYTKEGKVNAYLPFVGALTNEEFIEFAHNGIVKNFENYEYIEGKKTNIPGERLYVVGSFEIKKEKNIKEHEEKASKLEESKDEAKRLDEKLQELENQRSNEDK